MSSAIQLTCSEEHTFTRAEVQQLVNELSTPGEISETGKRILKDLRAALRKRRWVHLTLKTKQTKEISPARFATALRRVADALEK